MLALILIAAALAGDADLATTTVRLALVGEPAADAPAVPADAPAKLRAELDALVRAHPTAEVATAWSRRFPAPPDAAAERAWRALGSDPTPVVGVDAVAVPAATLAERLAVAAGDPWRDRRHAHRFTTGPDGRPIPDDPAADNLVAVDGDPSLHAFLTFADPKQVTNDPWAASWQANRYAADRAWPEGPALALATTHAQSSVDLALLAALSDDPDVQALGPVHLGNALGYVFSASMPVNTVWFGSAKFEEDANRRWWARGLVTVGGLLGAFEPVELVRGRIAGAHRALALRLAEQRLATAGDAEGEELRRRIAEGDLVMSRLLWRGYTEGGKEPTDGEFADLAMRFLAYDNAEDAKLTLDALHEVADPELQAGVVLDVAPYLALRADADPAHVTTFWEATQRGFRRAGVAVRSVSGLWGRFNAVERTPEQKLALRQQIADRLVRRLDSLRTDADARRAKWLTAPPVVADTHTDLRFLGAFIGVPVGLFVLVAVIAFAVRSARRFRVD